MEQKSGFYAGNKTSFYYQKYHSILRAAIIVEAVGFIVSLTDSIIAGNFIGDEAFAAIGLLINERNKDSKKPVNAECTLMIQPDGVRLIVRDSGVIFDITDEKAKADSYRQYVVSNLMVNHEAKLYMVTTGYNRNEFFFSRENN
jgi:hypothetical protein